MKGSYEEGLANYFGLQQRGGPRCILSVPAKGNSGFAGMSSSNGYSEASDGSRVQRHDEDIFGPDADW